MNALQINHCHRLNSLVAVRGGLVVGIYRPAEHGTEADFRREMAAA